LKGTTNLGLLYRKSLDYKLVGFCDVDYAGDIIERKSTSGKNNFNVLNFIRNTKAMKNGFQFCHQERSNTTNTRETQQPTTIIVSYKPNLQGLERELSSTLIWMILFEGGIHLTCLFDL